jgi:hypothetical protein
MMVGGTTGTGAIAGITVSGSGIGGVLGSSVDIRIPRGWRNDALGYRLLEYFNISDGTKAGGNQDESARSRI